MDADGVVGTGVADDNRSDDSDDSDCSDDGRTADDSADVVDAAADDNRSKPRFAREQQVLRACVPYVSQGAGCCGATSRAVITATYTCRVGGISRI